MQSAYGYCPRALCDKQRVIPNGMSDKLRQNRVKVYCPKCEELYIPQGSHRMDGAYFGSSLAHIFFQTYAKSIVLPPKVYYYEPVLNGFKIAGKRGSKFFKPKNGEITDTRERQKMLETDLAKRNQEDNSQNQQQRLAFPRSKSKHSKDKSRHRGKSKQVKNQPQ